MRMKLFAGTALGVFLLSGCAALVPAEEDSAMSVIEVQTRTTEILNGTQDILGADGWEFSSRWASCTDGPTDSLVQYVIFAQRFARTEGDLAQVGENVAARWRDFGINPTVQPISDSPGSYVVSDPPFLTGMRPDRVLSQLQFNGEVASLQLYSSCVEGDIADLNKPSPDPRQTNTKYRERLQRLRYRRNSWLSFY